jgi:hypothetical protein
MRTSPFVLFLKNIEGKFPQDSLYIIPREEALAELKKMTGEDFGYNAERWRAWKKRIDSTAKRRDPPANPNCL